MMDVRLCSIKTLSQLNTIIVFPDVNEITLNPEIWGEPKLRTWITLMYQWVRLWQVNTSVCWVVKLRVSGTPVSIRNPPSVFEYIPLSQLAVWLREPDQLLVRVEANRKLKFSSGSRIRGKWTGWQIYLQYTYGYSGGGVHSLDHFGTRACVSVRLISRVQQTLYSGVSVCWLS